MSNTAEVVKYLRKKSSSGFDSITYLGAEQCFVGALRGSNVHNLEEQFIIGTDTYTQTYTDENDNQIIEKEFHNGSLSSGFYKLVSTIYKEKSTNEDFFFRGEEIYLSNSEGALHFDDASSAIVSENDELCGVIDNNLIFFPIDYIPVRQDSLYFVNNTDITHILTKTTSKKYVSNNGTREIIRESIVRA